MLPRAAKGVFHQDFPPLLLLSAVKPVPRSQSQSSAVGQLRGEIRMGRRCSARPPCSSAAPKSPAEDRALLPPPPLPVLSAPVCAAWLGWPRVQRGGDGGFCGAGEWGGSPLPAL